MFLTNHAHGVARDPNLRLRDLAFEVGVTERAAQRIVRELAEAGDLTWERCGRRNQHTIHLDRRAFRHRLEARRSIGDVIALLDADAHPATAPRRDGGGSSVIQHNTQATVSVGEGVLNGARRTCAIGPRRVSRCWLWAT